MHDVSYRTLMRQAEFKYLLMLCAGVWLFAADGLMEATLLSDIVGDIGGANLISWGRSLFEVAAIITGMLAAFLVRRFGVRTSFVSCAVLFVIGCAISALADNMVMFQAGRFLQALSGSAFVSLTSIGIALIFSTIMLARAGSVVAIVWGFAAFSGPLVGGLFSQFASWRTAFVYLSIFGTILAVTSFFVLGGQRKLRLPQINDKAEPFPTLRIGVLVAGVVLIASGGIRFSPIITPLLLISGIVLMALFLKLDQRSADRQLLPTGVLQLSTKVGAASYLVLLISAATIGISVFSPILLVVLYDLAPIQIGFIMFTTALGWTFAEMKFSGTQPEHEGQVIIAGALIVIGAIFVFNLGLYGEMKWLFALGFFLEGIGLGMSWSLISRRAIADTSDLERSRIASSVHTLQRIGFALSAAGLGVLVNGLGFSEVMSVSTAFHVMQWILGLALPFALAGLAAAVVFAGARFNPTIDYAVNPAR